jgi:hypothetical protein
MTKKIKFTKVKIVKLKHPTGKQADKCYDLTCEILFDLRLYKFV